MAKKPVAKKTVKTAAKPSQPAKAKAAAVPAQKAVKPATSKTAVAPKKAAAAKKQPAAKSAAAKKPAAVEKKTVAAAKKPAADKAKSAPKVSIKISAGRASSERAPQVIKTQPAAKSKGRNKVRPSDSIVFTIDDLDAYLAMRASGATAAQTKSAAKQPAAKAGAAKNTVAPTVNKPTSSPKNPVAAASIFDILGFNPVDAPSLEKHQEKEIPRKWKKYYNLLVDLRKHHSKGAENISEEVLKRSAKEDSGDLSSYGQHLADAGSESFERDMAYNLLSNEKEMIAEIDAAIERIKNGTYGICEVTGEPIPESRLEAIPFTRCTKRGQEIKEAQSRKIKSAQRSIYDMSETSGSSEDDDMSS